uniref:Uncharacterized protein n=1 Tax=viral metagenome TaxID=1070528 RepID=A0A6C0ETR6_9ZZZZ
MTDSLNYEYIPLDESYYQEQITKEQIKYDESRIKYWEYRSLNTYPTYPTYPYISLNSKQYDEDVLKYHKDLLKYDEDVLKYNEEYISFCPSIINLERAKSDLRELKNYQKCINHNVNKYNANKYNVNYNKNETNETLRDKIKIKIKMD